jgi:hypothetical protein
VSDGVDKKIEIPTKTTYRQSPAATKAPQ